MMMMEPCGAFFSTSCLVSHIESEQHMLVRALIHGRIESERVREEEKEMKDMCTC